MKTKEYPTDYENTMIDFEITDQSGRKTGLRVSKWVSEFKGFEPGPFESFFQIEPGIYYGLKIQPTRDGKDFGSIQQRKFFKTDTERDQETGRRVKESKKRIQKKFQ